MLSCKIWEVFNNTYFEDMAQKMKFSIKDLLSKCGQIRSFMRIWSHLLRKSLIENFIFVPWELKTDN